MLRRAAVEGDPPGSLPAAGPRPAPGFEEQLFRVVRGSPPVLASCALHAAAILLALVLAPEPGGGGLRGVSLSVSREAAIGTEADAATPRVDRPDPIGDVAVPMETLPDPLSGEPEEAPPEGGDRDPGPPSLGPDIEKVLAVGGRRVRPRTAPAKVEFQGNPAFRGEEAAAANREAADLVRGSLDGGLSGERALLRRIDPRRVLVCTGCYDRTEDVLGLLGVRHDVLRMEEIGAAPLAPDALLLVDCGVDRLGPESAAKVRDFVASGGYLCTTDWGLENVLVPAFPGVLEAVRRKGREVVTVEEVVPFTVSAPGHPLVRALQAAAEDGTWWLEDQSHPIRVVDRRRAVVLAESPELRERYGSAVLAVTFEWGHGRVLHLLGHAWQKEGNLKGTFALQRILVNFLLDRAQTSVPLPSRAVPR